MDGNRWWLQPVRICMMLVPVSMKASFISAERDIGDLWKVELKKWIAQDGWEKNYLQKKIYITMKEFQPHLASWMEPGLSSHISTPITSNCVWPLSLRKQLAYYCILGSAKSIVTHVLEGFHRKIMLVTWTEKFHLQRELLTLCGGGGEEVLEAEMNQGYCSTQYVSISPKECSRIEYASLSLSVPTMQASTLCVHSGYLSIIIYLSRVMETSTSKYGRSSSV